MSIWLVCVSGLYVYLACMCTWLVCVSGFCGFCRFCLRTVLFPREELSARLEAGTILYYTILNSWIERPVNRKERLYHGLYLGYILAHFIRFLETLQILCFIERTYRLCIISPSHIPQNTLQQYFKCCDLSFNRQILVWRFFKTKWLKKISPNLNKLGKNQTNMFQFCDITSFQKCFNPNSDLYL